MSGVSKWDTIIGRQFNTTVYLVYLVVVGFLGVHRWYERKNLSGWLYFLTFGYCGVGVIVDMVSFGIGRLRTVDGAKVSAPTIAKVVSLAVAVFFTIAVFLTAYVTIEIIVSNL